MCVSMYVLFYRIALTYTFRKKKKSEKECVNVLGIYNNQVYMYASLKELQEKDGVFMYIYIRVRVQKPLWSKEKISPLVIV